MDELTSIEQADALIDGDAPAWILKHSNSCPISSMVKADEVDAYFERHAGQPAVIVVVQTHREVSNHIAARLDVKHESPQMLLVRGGEALWHKSHGRITADEMAEAYADASR